MPKRSCDDSCNTWPAYFLLQYQKYASEKSMSPVLPNKGFPSLEYSLQRGVAPQNKTLVSRVVNQWVVCSQLLWGPRPHISFSEAVSRANPLPSQNLLWSGATLNVVSCRGRRYGSRNSGNARATRVAFPKLNDAQIAQLAAFSVPRHVQPREVLFVREPRIAVSF